MKQHKILLPPATEYDFLASRVACMAAMSDKGRAEAEIHFNTYRAKYKWYSPTQPNPPDKPAAAKKSAPPKR